MKLRSRFLVFLLISVYTVALGESPRMRVHCIDVGQGTSTLLEFPCGAVLVDTGGESNPQFKSEAALLSYLDAFFARRADLHNRLTSLIISHPHKDHTKGIDEVLAKYRPLNAVTDGLLTGSGVAAQNRLQQAAAEAEGTPQADDDIKFETVDEDKIPSTGLTDGIIDPINCSEINPVLRVLWGHVLKTDFGWSESEMNNENEHSIVLRVEFGNASILLPGDLEEEGIKELVKKFGAGQLLNVDVYVAGHHGSKNGTTSELVDKMTPEIAVIPMGPPNRQLDWTAWAYGHPNKGVVEMLEHAITRKREPIDVQVGLGAKDFEARNETHAIYATGWDGNVVLEADANGKWTVISPEPAEPEAPSAPAAGKLNLNRATFEQLVALATITSKRAHAIIDYRQAHGPFAKIEDIDKVPGIGPATIQTLRPFVTVE